MVTNRLLSFSVIAVLLTCIVVLSGFANAQGAFQDIALETVIRDMLGNHQDPLSLEDLVTIKKVDAPGKGIRSLAGMEALVNLEVLNLYHNEVEDLEPLAGLIHLVDLNIGRNGEVKDAKPLAGLTNLTSLGIRETKIEDISVLAPLVKLEYLQMRGTPITNVDVLANFPKLNTLHLRESAVEDVAVLAKLPVLAIVALHNMPNLDLSPGSPGRAVVDGLVAKGVDVRGVK